MNEKEKCIQRARELAVQYQKTLVGCAHCSFAAALDALREFGVEIVPSEVEETMFKGLVGLTAGVGNMGLGTCGAVTGATFAVSLACGVGSEQLEEKGKGQRWISYYHCKEGVAKEFLEKYGSIVCRDMQIKMFGMAFNSRVPGRNKELFAASVKRACENPRDCTIAMGAALAVERIWDIVHNPEDVNWVVEKHEK